MQRVQILGRIGKDAEVKEFNGNSVISFNVAVTEKWTDKQGQKQEATTWYQCSKWGQHTGIAQFLLKGANVLVEGKPEARSYANQQTGEINQVIGINVNTIEIAEFVKNEQQQQQPNNNGQFQQQAPQQQGGFNQQQAQNNTFNGQGGFNNQQQQGFNQGQGQQDLPF